MIWGVGTGRCGTKSLAKSLGGIHEPQPWFQDEPKKWWLSGEPSAELALTILDRREMDTPIVVDFKHSYIMPLIKQIDPKASFVWVIREPVQCIKSMVHGKWWGETDNNGANLIEPYAGFFWGLTRVYKCIWYYEKVNREIYKHIKDISLIVYTEDLLEHENKYPEEAKTEKLHEIELANIHDRCDSIYKIAREL